MDQVKAIFGGIKKYHFWILCVIVIIVGLTSWYMSTSTLRAETDKNAANIKQKVDAVNAINNINPHPNTAFVEGMDKMIEEYSNNLGKGWQYRYNQQKSLLVWPKSLGEDFKKQVDRLRPIEDFVTFDDKGYVPSQEIHPDYRELYRNFIAGELPSLAAQIGAKWSAKVGEARSTSSSSGKSMSGSQGYGGISGMKSAPKASGYESEGDEEDDSIVRWNPANQQEILDVHFGFTAEEATPHTLDVLYAQEDLWVLDAIIKVIQRTNAGADANYNAAIKEIESIQMGRTVKGRLGQIKSLDQTAASGGMSGMGMSGMSMAPSASMGPPPGTGASSSGAAAPSGNMAPPSGGSSAPQGSSSMGPAPGGSSSSMSATAGPVDPAIGRYVDIDYNPLEPKKLRDARTSQDPTLAIYSVAKRMPVALRLKIDQRKLNDLLTECGNSSLPIEVRQVRINCEATPGGDGRGMGGSSFAPSSSGSSGSSMGPAPSSSGSSMGPAPGGSSSGSKSRRSGFGGAAPGNDELKADPNEIVVDVYGIVHIYNPLNQTQLNTNLRDDDGTAPAAPAAPATPESPTAATPAATTRS